MTDPNRSDDWRVLCELASKEKDPEKLIDLVAKINQALEDRQRNSLCRVDENAASNNPGNNAGPQLSQVAESDC